MTSPRSSTSTTSSAASAVPRKQHQVSSMCIEKGKWYDCLRPTDKPYQGFGGMASFNMPGENKAGTNENWTHEVYGKLR